MYRIALVLSMLFCSFSALAVNNVIFTNKSTATVQQSINELITNGWTIDSISVDTGSTAIINAYNSGFVLTVGSTQYHITDIADNANTTELLINALNDNISGYASGFTYTNFSSVLYPRIDNTFILPAPNWTYNNTSCYVDRVNLGGPSIYNPKTMIIDSNYVNPGREYTGTLVGHIASDNSISESNLTALADSTVDTHATDMGYIENQFIGSTIYTEKDTNPVYMNEAVNTAIRVGAKTISLSTTALGTSIIPSNNGQVTQRNIMNRAFDNGILPINSFGNGWYNGPFGPLYDMGMDSDKILMVADIYKDSQGFTQNLLGACALPWQDPPDVAVDSTGIFTITPNDRTKGSSSESTAIMNGIALRTFTKYSAVNNGLGLSNKDMMSSIINSTRIANNTVTKNACFGYGKVDECALRSYIERNYPVRNWTPNWVANCSSTSGGCTSSYDDYSKTVGGNANYAKAMDEQCNKSGGHMIHVSSTGGGGPLNTQQCFYPDNITPIPLTTYRDLNTPKGVNGAPSGLVYQFYSAWPDGVPH